MTGIAVFGHGSSVETANQAVRDFTAELGRRGGFPLIEASFLELGKPDLPEAVARLVTGGATRVVVIPYFLTLGIHLKRDLPRIAAELRGIYKAVRIDVTEPMDGHPALIDVLLDRAKDALDGGSTSASQIG
jgi:sirohydrochlorin ferrochelatase